MPKTYTKEEILALLEATTWGEWRTTEHTGVGIITLYAHQAPMENPDVALLPFADGHPTQARANAAFLAASKAIVLQLLQENADLRAQQVHNLGLQEGDL